MASPPAQILVVDDDQDIRALLKLALELEGFEVQTAQNGIQALQILRDNFTPSLILVDLMMPNMDGETFLSHLKEDPNLCRLPAVIMSGDNEAVAKSARFSGTAGLVKPVDLAKLLTVVNQFVVQVGNCKTN